MRRQVRGLLDGLPTGFTYVGFGLVVSALSAYAFQIIAFRQLDAGSFSALSGLWIVVFALGPGLFLSLEQELARAVSHRCARGEGCRPLIVVTVIVGAITLLIALVALLGFQDFLVERFFRGNSIMMVALVIAMAAVAFSSIARGVLAGNRDFGRYSLSIGGEGLLRVLLAGVAVFLGASSLTSFSFALAAAPVVAAAITLIGLSGVAEPGPKAVRREVSSAYGWLLVAALTSQVMAYAAYAVASVRLPEDQSGILSAFAAGLFLARAPLILLAAAQVTTLPALARKVALGDLEGLRIQLRRILVVSVLVSAMLTVFAFLLGSRIGVLLFGSYFTLDRWIISGLVVAVCATMIAIVCAQALIAMQKYQLHAVGWISGLCAFAVVALCLPAAPISVSTVAFVVGSIVVLGWMYVASSRLTRERVSAI